MALMERVATLLRANVNDMMDRAEDPEKMLKQLVRDLENQLLQLKTQLAIAIADKHQMIARLKVEVDAEKSWREKASLALSKGKEEMARAALERAVQHDQMVEEMTAQLAEHSDEVDSMRAMYTKLDGKLKTASHHVVLLSSQLKRAQVSGKAMTARQAADQVAMTIRSGPALERLRSKVEGTQAANSATRELMEGESLEESFAEMERGERVDRLLEELKMKQGMLEAG